MTELEFARLVYATGGRVYRVGGSVRDSCMGLHAKDRDYVVTGMGQERFSAAFPAAVMTGQAFPVFRLAVGGALCEVAMARTERKQGVGHTGFVCDAGPGVHLEQDLRRRDLTVNAMAIDPLDGRLIDPYGGLNDLRAGVLRAVSGAFAEDPLRVYRTARFAVQLQFSVDGATLRLMGDLVDELARLPAERVYEETAKALACAAPSGYFRVLERCGALSVHFGELEALAALPADGGETGDDAGAGGALATAFDPALRPAGAVTRLDVALAALDSAALASRDITVRFAALAQFVGAGPGEDSRADGHEAAGKAAVRRLANRIKAPARWSAAGECAAACAPALRSPAALTPPVAARLLSAAERSPLGMVGLGIVVEAGIGAEAGQAHRRGRSYADVTGTADGCARQAEREDRRARQAAVRRLLHTWQAILEQVNGHTLERLAGESGKDYGDRLHQTRVERLARAWRGADGASAAKG